MKKGDRIQDVRGNTYTAIKRIGRGGQAPVWKVEDDRTKRSYAYKYYKSDPNNVRSNIEVLMEEAPHRVRDRNGNPLNCVVWPLYIVEGNNNGFGYIMELVDLQNYTTLPSAWCAHALPDRKVICKIIQNLADFFIALHASAGWCYKDINEENIYFNPTTGDIKIIDNDNVGPSSRVSIRGTLGYMAPEVILGDDPDQWSDSFSFAVYVFRLLTYANPFYGKKVRNYCIHNNVIDYEIDVAEKLYGTEALYIWHPTDRRNSIEGYEVSSWRGQAQLYHQLPDSIKDLFQETFVTNLPKARKGERATAEDWKMVFENLERTLDRCSICGGLNFHGSPTCIECEKPLGRATLPQKTVRIKINSIGDPMREMELISATKPEDYVAGEAISRHLPKGKFLKILTNKKGTSVGIRNISELPWTIQKPGQKKKEKCLYKQIQELVPGMIILFKPNEVQIKILEIK